MSLFDGKFCPQDDDNEGLKTSFTDEPICPYCGHAEKDAWEINFDGGVEGDAEHTCGECGKEYLINKMVSISYTTTKIKDSP